MRRSLIVVLLVLAGVAAPSAQAGTYGVRACATDAGTYPNRAWTIALPSANWTAATTCPQLTVNLLPGAVLPAGEVASMTFVPPQGTAIRDFALTRQIYYYNPPNSAEQPPPFVIYSWGGLVFSGVGAYDAATREAVNNAAPSQWYGYPQGAIDTGAPTVTRATFPLLAGAGDASYLQIQLGCFTGTCVLRGGSDPANPPGAVFNTTYGAVVTVADDSRPGLTTAGDGLFAPGSHGGDEGTTFTAADNVGIRRAELIDLTVPASTRVVGSKTFHCDFSRPRPCDDVNGGSVAPSTRLPSGLRTLAVRVTDTAGNQTTSSPVGAFVGGPLNGTNASQSGRLRAVFTRGGKTRRTVKAGGRPAVSLTLRDAAKHPIGGARIQVRSRQRRTGAHFRAIGVLMTDAKGRVKVTLRKGTSRELRFEYRTRVDDPAPALRTRVLLGVRPRATLRIRPRHVGAGGQIRLSGRVLSGPRPRPGKLVVLQAFDRGRWRTFAITRSHKRGRYTRAYRFTRSGGRTFRFRAHLPREGAYPYSTGNSHTVRVRVG